MQGTPGAGGPALLTFLGAGGVLRARPARRGNHRVVQQHRARHRPDAARHRRDRRRLLRSPPRSPRRPPGGVRSSCVASGIEVDADVDDDGAFAHHVGRDRAGLAHRRDEDVGLAACAPPRSACPCDRRVTVALPPGALRISRPASGLPTRFERPQTTTCLPAGSIPRAQQHLDDAVRRAGDEPRLAAEQPPDVHRVQAVDVLLRRDGRRRRRLRRCAAAAASARGCRASADRRSARARAPAVRPA